MKKEVVVYTLISAGLIFLTGYMPVVGSILLFASVIPQLILLYDDKYFSAVLSWLLVLGLIYGLKDSFFLYTYLTVFVVYAVSYRFILKKNKKPVQIILKASVIWIALWVLWLVVTELILDINFIKESALFLKSGLAESVGGMYSLDLEISHVAIIEKSFLNLVEFFKKSFFGFSIIWAVAGSYLVYSLLSFKRKSVKSPGSLLKFRLPENMVWLLLIGIVLYLAGNKIGNYNIINLTGGNLSIVFLAGYMITGMSLAVFFFEKINISGWLRNLFIVLIVLFLRGFWIFTATGLADVWFDFRKIDKNEKSN